jgi:hypothetical protein
MLVHGGEVVRDVAKRTAALPSHDQIVERKGMFFIVIKRPDTPDVPEKALPLRVIRGVKRYLIRDPGWKAKGMGSQVTRVLRAIFQSPPDYDRFSGREWCRFVVVVLFPDAVKRQLGTAVVAKGPRPGDRSQADPRSALQSARPGRPERGGRDRDAQPVPARRRAPDPGRWDQGLAERHFPE